jgi:hypothetical protein
MKILTITITGVVVEYGVPVTNEDNQARVRAALAHPVMGRWSQGKIAEACAVSVPFVGVIQRPRVNDLDAGVEGKNG